MTPEQLEAIPGIDEDAVNRIQQAINGYYGQDYAEASASDAEAAEPESVEATAETPDNEAPESGGEPLGISEHNEAEEISDSVENAEESTSATMNEPVEAINGAEGESAVEGEPSTPVEPQAGR